MTDTGYADLIKRLRVRASHLVDAPWPPVKARGRFPEPTISDTVEGQAADALEGFAERISQINMALSGSCEVDSDLDPLDVIQAMKDQSREQGQALAEAERVIRPFASESDKYEPDEGDAHHDAWDTMFQIGDIRAARAWLTRHATGQRQEREPLAAGREHLTVSGRFQSDRYPGCPAGKVPLSTKDPLAQDLLWEYARRHEAAAKHGDSEFPRDLREALANAGFATGQRQGGDDE